MAMPAAAAPVDSARQLPPPVNASMQIFCALCSPAATIMWLVGFLLMAGFAPPLDPTWSAEQIAAYYRDHADMIRGGMALTMLGAAFLGPFYAVISTQMRRVEGEHSPLATAQFGLGVVTVLLFVIPCFLFGTAAFRLDRDPELIMLMNDAGWLPFVGAFQTTFMQLICFALVCFRDRSGKVFPRWVGYWNLWSAMSLLMTTLVLFYRTGPFAWNGGLSFWFVLVEFCLWFVLMPVVVIRAVRLQKADAVAAGQLL